MTTPDQLRNQREELETPAGAAARFPSFRASREMMPFLAGAGREATTLGGVRKGRRGCRCSQPHLRRQLQGCVPRLTNSLTSWTGSVASISESTRYWPRFLRTGTRCLPRLPQRRELRSVTG